MAARLTAAWPGAALSCASASRNGGWDGSGAALKASSATLGTSAIAPTSRQAIAA